MKVLPKLKYCVHSGYGTSTNYFRGLNKITRDTEQGIKVSSDRCRDILSFIVKNKDLKVEHLN